MNHDWKNATCTEPKTCSKCGETEGEALGHDWQDATCTLPITCERCGLTKGEALGHDFSDATCTEAKTCLVCGATEGKALGHDWEDATCTEAKTCTRCGETEGKPLGHAVEEWTIITEASCSEEGLQSGVCTVCGEEVEEAIEKLEHTPGEWIVTVPAQSDKDGEREIQCTVCGETLKHESYEMTEEEKEDAFKAECEWYSYDTIARNPGDYLLEKVAFRGEVIQSMEKGDNYTLRVNVTQGRYTWSDTIYVEYTKNDPNEPRILEDDIITLYGFAFDTITYETVLGAKVTIPAVLASYIDIE